MTEIYDYIHQTIGNTPIVKLNKLNIGLKPTILLKCEFFNPMSSIKDRIALSMIEQAEKAGILEDYSHIVEPTSGNTGIGLAMVCASKGYKLTLFMPDSMSIERRKILRALGAEIILTPAEEGMKKAIEKAQELANSNENIFIPNQFKNKANAEIHRKTTAQEILKATDGKLDAFVAGIGTGGTLTGVGEGLRKELGDSLKIYGIEPDDSPVLTEGISGSHEIQGIGAGFIPEILNTSIYDKIIRVKNNEAAQTARMLAKKEGIFAGMSSGAAVWATLKVAQEFDEDQALLTILPDTGERYLSTGLWEINEIKEVKEW